MGILPCSALPSPARCRGFNGISENYARETRGSMKIVIKHLLLNVSHGKLQSLKKAHIRRHAFLSPLTMSRHAIAICLGTFCPHVDLCGGLPPHRDSSS